MIKLNLLPTERKQLIAGQRRNRVVIFWGSTAVTVVAFIAVGLLALTIYEGTILSSLEGRLEQTKEELKQYAEIENLVVGMRDRVATLATQEKSRVLWSNVFDELAATTPEGVQLTQLSITIANTPHLTFGGRAASKEKVATLRERLESSQRFEQVNVRQVGQTLDERGVTVTTFSIEANLTGVAVPKPPARSQGESSP